MRLHTGRSEAPRSPDDLPDHPPLSPGHGRIPQVLNSIPLRISPKTALGSPIRHNRSDYIRISTRRVPILLTLLVSACTTAAPPAPVALREDAAETTAAADWDDADAAVYGGLQASDVAVSRVVEVSPARREYHLRAMSGEDGLLVIERTPDSTATAAEASRLTLHCTIGRLGDAELERQVVELVLERLHALAGREFAPFPD